MDFNSIISAAIIAFIGALPDIIKSIIKSFNRRNKKHRKHKKK